MVWILFSKVYDTLTPNPNFIKKEISFAKFNYTAKIRSKLQISHTYFFGCCDRSMHAHVFIVIPGDSRNNHFSVGTPLQVWKLRYDVFNNLHSIYIYGLCVYKFGTEITLVDWITLWLNQYFMHAASIYCLYWYIGVKHNN